MISVHEAGRVFRMGEVDVPALRCASLDIYEGEFLMIVGPSGSGKSTLLNIIGGMDRPTSGSMKVLDQDLTRASDYQLTLFRRNEVGFVFQFYNLVPTLTALENIQVATEIVPNPLPGLDALEMVGLREKAHHFPSQLSGGQQQRVSIARALAKNPRLLLCDEPTGALDSESSKQVLALLSELNKKLNKTIVIITHNPALMGIANRVATIRDGVIASLVVNEHTKTVGEIEW